MSTIELRKLYYSYMDRPEYEPVTDEQRRAFEASSVDMVKEIDCVMRDKEMGAEEAAKLKFY